MWCAMGQCYESDQLGMTDAAVRCYTRAVRNNDREGIALHKLAKVGCGPLPVANATPYRSFDLAHECVGALRWA